MGELVSIIVPVYNVGEYLTKCLSSIVSQTYSNLEIILVDDGSTDGSGEVCDKCADADKRVCVFHRKNSGVSVSRNYGLENANGTWVMFVDADDWLVPNAIELLVGRVAEGVDIVYSNIFIWNGIESKTHTSFATAEDKVTLMRNLLTDGWGGLGFNRIVRRSLLIDNNLKYPTHICYCEDLWLAVKLFFFAGKVRKTEEPIYYYNRANINSATQTFNESKEDDSLICMRELMDFFKEKGMFEEFKNELYWHVLLCKSTMVFNRSRHGKFMKVFPDANDYIDGNPFLHKNLRIAMKMIKNHVGWLIPLAQIIRRR